MIVPGSLSSPPHAPQPTRARRGRPMGFVVSARERECAERRALVERLKAEYAVLLPQWERAWAARQLARAQAARGERPAPVPGYRPSYPRVLLAYERGYRVLPDGRLVDRRGAELYTRELRFCPSPARHAAPQRDSSVRKASLAAYCFFGSAGLRRGACLRYRNGDPTDLRRANVALSFRGRGRYEKKLTDAEAAAFLSVLRAAGPRPPFTALARRWTAAHPDRPIGPDLLRRLRDGRTYVPLHGAALGGEVA